MCVVIQQIVDMYLILINSINIFRPSARIWSVLR